MSTTRFIVQIRSQAIANTDNLKVFRRKSTKGPKETEISIKLIIETISMPKH